jgi:hypothetical protein
LLNVGTTVEKCKTGHDVDIRVATLGEVDDPSHTGIYGYVQHNAKTAETLSKLIDPNEVYSPI